MRLAAATAWSCLFGYTKGWEAGWGSVCLSAGPVWRRMKSSWISLSQPTYSGQVTPGSWLAGVSGLAQGPSGRLARPPPCQTALAGCLEDHRATLKQCQQNASCIESTCRPGSSHNPKGGSGLKPVGGDLRGHALPAYTLLFMSSALLACASTVWAPWPRQRGCPS